MGKADTLKEFTKADIDKLIKEEKRAIVIFEGDVFDASDFKITHPGGPKFIDDHLGEDITQLFYEEEHTKIALRLLNELKIGTLSAAADEQISNTTQHTDTKMKLIQDEPWRAKIDPAEGTVWQVFSKLNKEEYDKFINDPKHLTRPEDVHRMFKSEFCEFFSRTPWYHIGLFWTPVVIYKLCKSYYELSLPEIVLYFIFGMFHWTFLEYTLHRFVFHMENIIPDNKYWITLHYIFHGVHHAFPMDKDRLVFPIVLAVPMYYLIHWIFSQLYPAIIINTMSAGVIFAYMCYDMGHYYLHHSQPLKIVEYRKKYHMYHHYKDPDNGYGITTSFWDKIFGTELDMSKKQSKKFTS